jgi:hypothetical protein
MEVSARHYTLAIDDRTGALRSLRDVRWPDHELLDALHRTLPLFTIQYLDEQHQFRQISSDQAQHCELRRSDEPEETRIHLTHSRVGDRDVDVAVTIRCPHDDHLSYWSLSLSQRTPLTITDIYFPFVVVPYRYEGRGPTHLLVPLNQGELYRQPRPEQLQPDYPDVWQFTEDLAHFVHYPGTTFAQFLAYYDEQQGVYLGCHDADLRHDVMETRELGQMATLPLILPPLSVASVECGTA